HDALPVSAWVRPRRAAVEEGVVPEEDPAPAAGEGPGREPRPGHLLAVEGGHLLRLGGPVAAVVEAVLAGGELVVGEAVRAGDVDERAALRVDVLERDPGGDEGRGGPRLHEDRVSVERLL